MLIRGGARPTRRLLCKVDRGVSILRQQGRNFSAAAAAAGDDGETREEKLLAYHDSKIRTVEQLLAERKKDQGNQYQGSPYFSVDQNASVLDAVQTMVERDVGSLWVEDAGSPAGIVTERDYLRKVVVRGLNSADTAVGEIMTPFAQVIAVTPSATILECLGIMNEKQFRHLPVVTSLDAPADAQVVAMISMKDLIKQFTRYHEAQVKYLQEYIPFEVW